MDRLNTASWYTQSRPGALTETEKTLISQAKEALINALEQTNSFYKTDWMQFLQEANKIKLNPLKNYNPVHIE